MQALSLKAVEEALAKRKTLGKPYPRVLTIGDSISGYYAHHVRHKLEGKAAVYHAPGNNGSSDMVMEGIDKFLLLETYKLKGHEYMELVESVKAVLKDPKEFYPEYSGQKLELSGFVWFQGIRDSEREATAKEYEANLSGLFNDLRKEFEVPGMPVVVASSPFGDKKSGSAEKIVYDAQMAVGNPKGHPEFAGSVKSVDTTPFFRGRSQSPGIPIRHGRGFRPERYYYNAESFLLIGEAMGKTMLELLEKQ